MANSVDEFSYSLLNPLKSDIEFRHAFADSLDHVMDASIEMEQKKVRNPQSFSVDLTDSRMFYRWLVCTTLADNTKKLFLSMFLWITAENQRAKYDPMGHGRFGGHFVGLGNKSQVQGTVNAKKQEP